MLSAVEDWLIAGQETSYGDSGCGHFCLCVGITSEVKFALTPEFLYRE